MRIRSAVPADAAAVLAIQREAAEERWSIATQPEEVRGAEEEAARIAAWTPRTGTLLVAEAEGRVVGFVAVVRGGRASSAHVGDVGLTVAASHRGRGVGRALMLAAEDWARKAGVERLTLTVFAHNERARRLYASLGYVEEGVRRAQHRLRGRDVDEVLMAKPLHP